MRYQLPDSRVLNSGTPFELAGDSYPSNWLDLAGDDDLAQRGIARLPDAAPTPEQIAAQYVAAVQNHMDAKARERRYDNIVSACSYAAAPNAFQAESQAYLTWRAACWQHLYQMQADVLAQARTLPSIDELIAELPALVLP